MEVRIEGLCKGYGSQPVLENLDITIPQGELFFLVGSSGCGKSTLLRIVAGLLAPDSGRLLFDGRDVTRLPAEQRGIGLVFQNYALWPHMTVFENVAFGLEARGLKGEAVRARVAAALSQVRLQDLGGRYPAELSGGQQQRVALARALVIEPGLVLLDEPLSNLDAGLRLEMRGEIRRIHRETGVTMIYVTHDQKEALSMADRLAVLNRGRLEQVGTPREVYGLPRTRFVAGFVGETNFLPARFLERQGEDWLLEAPWGRSLLPCGRCFGPWEGAEAELSLRPEALSPAGPAGSAGTAGTVRFPALVRECNFLGETVQLVLEAFGQRLEAVAMGGLEEVRPGETLEMVASLGAATAYAR